MELVHARFENRVDRTEQRDTILVAVLGRARNDTDRHQLLDRCAVFELDRHLCVVAHVATWYVQLQRHDAIPRNHDGCHHRAPAVSARPLERVVDVARSVHDAERGEHGQQDVRRRDPSPSIDVAVRELHARGLSEHPQRLARGSSRHARLRRRRRIPPSGSQTQSGRLSSS